MTKETDRARRYRRDSTSGEQAAWKVLRRFRSLGYPVRRQHPIGDMIVDFAVERANLVIEIDGSIHHRDDVIERDAFRDTKLKELGWQVMRLPNELAFHPDHLFRAVSEKLGL